MGSLELFHLYHHFVILDDVRPSCEPKTGGGAPRRWLRRAAHQGGEKTKTSWKSHENTQKSSKVITFSSIFNVFRLQKDVNDVYLCLFMALFSLCQEKIVEIMEYSNTVEGFVEELRVKSFGAWRSFPKVLLDCTLTKARCLAKTKVTQDLGLIFAPFHCALRSFRKGAVFHFRFWSQRVVNPPRFAFAISFFVWKPPRFSLFFCMQEQT